MHLDTPPLPYDQDDLEPHISEEVMKAHYDRYIGYINKLNKIKYVKELPEYPLEQIILDAIDQENEYMYNMASQIWNHTFYWHSLKKDGGGVPSGKIAALIKRDFRSFEDFKIKFVNESQSLFGSGWQFLVFNPTLGRLQIFFGKDAETPFPFKLIPLFVIDLWEHAFQCDYENNRTEYVQTLLDECLNWGFVNDNCKRARL